MSSPIQAGSRLLPFNRETPGSWQIWESFWTAFLNSSPLLPWPGTPTVFKKVLLAEKWGAPGGSQDGIDIRAEMDDGTILAIQCKDSRRYDPKKAKAAMNKAEREFKDASAYFLVLTQLDVPLTLRKEADRRGNWRVVGRDTLSDWFLSGKFLPPSEQKQLVDDFFGRAEMRRLFPISGDELLITPPSFFQRKNLIRHDGELHGDQSIQLAEALATRMANALRPRVSVLIAAGGQGKTRLLKAVADLLASKHPERNVLFQNDSADKQAEDYGLRADVFSGTAIFIDDAHRLENLRARLLERVSKTSDATLLIAARPNSLEALRKKLRESGFSEEDWIEEQVPVLGFRDRMSIASELLQNQNGELAKWLAEQSKDCLLVCTVGAELFASGQIGDFLIGSLDFKQRVFGHLVESSLFSLFQDDPKARELAECLLRITAVAGPLRTNDEILRKIAKLAHCPPFQIERLLPQLQQTGLIRLSRGSISVIPDLLADHLVYDSAYGEGRMPTLIRDVITAFGSHGLANLFSSLGEAEWRARQESKSESYLDELWLAVEELLQDPDDDRIFAFLESWKKFAIFQPERTLALAEIIRGHELERLEKGRPEIRYGGVRYDSISMHLRKLPEILSPVAVYHPDSREEALDLLWDIGLTQKDGDLTVGNPTAWNVIIQTASYGTWATGGPEGVLKWLKKWAKRKEGRCSLVKGEPFLSDISSQWFSSKFRDSTVEFRIFQKMAARTNSVNGFRDDVLNWISSEVITTGENPSWSAFRSLQAAGRLKVRRVDPETNTVSIERPMAEGVLSLLHKILESSQNDFFRCEIWRYASEKTAEESREENSIDWKGLRKLVSTDLGFKLVRIASGFAIHEWRLERLATTEDSKDYETSKRWWAEFASVTARELRAAQVDVSVSLEVIAKANSSLVNFGHRPMWDHLAEAWSASFLSERRSVIEELFKSPGHGLVPCLGYFIGLTSETDNEEAESLTLQALTHTDNRIREAALKRLSRRDVKYRMRIGERLRKMAASDDRSIIAGMVRFISWNQYEATPYFDEVLGSLNGKALSTEDLMQIGEAIASLIEYSKHEVSKELLSAIFERLKSEIDLNKALSDHTRSILHSTFPHEMYDVYLSRVRQGVGLPWALDDWALRELAKDSDFPSLSQNLLRETLEANEDLFYLFRELFDVAVALVKPSFAGDLLLAELENRSLEKIVELTGSGHGSVVYDSPKFLRQLLGKINSLPTREAIKLNRRLVYLAGPNSWSSSGGKIDKECLWARERASALAEEFRSDPLLREFFLTIIDHQDDTFRNFSRPHPDNE